MLETFPIPAPPVNVIGSAYSVVPDAQVFALSPVFIEIFPSPQVKAGTSKLDTSTS